MKLQIILSILTGLTLSACSTTPKNPDAPVVLEQHKNIQAEPTTKHNLARLIKQRDNCVIEFTGNFSDQAKPQNTRSLKAINSFQHFQMSMLM